MNNNRKFILEHIRNIGITAHIDAGKTTTTERILFYTGVVHKIGEVHEGSAVTDWMEQERERGITITSAAISCEWTAESGLFSNIEHHINLIDTPGHVDFTAEVERSLRVLDGAIAVFCGVAGVQPQSETVWHQMEKYNVPRIAFINKMDRLGADFHKAIKDIRTKLKGNAHPLFLPIKSETELTGIIDLIEECAYIYDKDDEYGINLQKKSIPEEYLEQFMTYKSSLIEGIADCNNMIAEKFLNDEEITSKDLYLAIREATISLKFIGVIPGSSFKNKGIQLLLNSIINYLPSPKDLPAIKGLDKEEEVINIKQEDEGSLCGLAFKLWSDPYVGKLVFFRIYRGILKKGSVLYNSRTKKKERISRLMIMKANNREDIDVAFAGDICALVGIKDVITGDTLFGQGEYIMLERPSFPEPVISMSIEPKTKADQEKLSIGLQRLSEEDPTFLVTTNNETLQTLISGMGELHLEIIKDRLFREFQVDANSSKPQIAYRETIKKISSGEGKFIKQSGGRGQYGHVIIKLYPDEKGKGINIINKIVGGSIPREFIKPTIEGIKEGAKTGIIAGYPVTDFIVELIEGSFHEVDSSEIAFKMAGIFAFKDAMKKANPVMLEPIMLVEVSTPEEYQGDIIGDINRRRGQIKNIETTPSICKITSYVPLEKMFGYATDIRSLSKGRSSYSMIPAYFKEIPENILEKIINKDK